MHRHDPKLLGEYLQSPYFKREKYELFALQHVQMLVRSIAFPRRLP